MTTIDHTLIQQYGVWDGAESYPRGEGYLSAAQLSPSEAGPSVQTLEICASSSSPLTDILASLNLLHNENKRIIRRIDIVSQRQDIFTQYNAEIVTIVSNIYSQFGEDDPESVPFHFPRCLCSLHIHDYLLRQTMTTIVTTMTKAITSDSIATADTPTLIATLLDNEGIACFKFRGRFHFISFIYMSCYV